MPIAFDLSELPVLLVQYRGDPSVAEFGAYLVQLRDVYRKSRPFSLVFDSRTATAPAPQLRKLQADWMRENEVAIRNLNLGTAFVMDSSFLRGALTAVLWLQPLPCPHFVTGDIGEAMRWARQRVQSTGTSVRP